MSTRRFFQVQASPLIVTASENGNWVTVTECHSNQELYIGRAGLLFSCVWNLAQKIIPSRSPICELDWDSDNFSANPLRFNFNRVRPIFIAKRSNSLSSVVAVPCGLHLDVTKSLIKKRTALFITAYLSPHAQSFPCTLVRFRHITLAFGE